MRGRVCEPPPQPTPPPRHPCQDSERNDCHTAATCRATGAQSYTCQCLQVWLWENCFEKIFCPPLSPRGTQEKGRMRDRHNGAEMERKYFRTFLIAGLRGQESGYGQTGTNLRTCAASLSRSRSKRLPRCRHLQWSAWTREVHLPVTIYPFVCIKMMNLNLKLPRWIYRRFA